MRVISRRKLQAFWKAHPRTEAPLNAWHRTAEHSSWWTPHDVRDTYRSADPVGDEFVVFDICNNDYRLVVRVDYRRQIVYVWDVYTHRDYDKLDLKALEERIKEERKRQRES